MEFKILYKNKASFFTPSQRGFTLFELVLSVTLILVLSSWLLVNLHPDEARRRARDNKRLSSISKLETIVLNYQLNTNFYPGDENVLYQSNILPPPCSDISNASCGWIKEDVSEYSENLPVDPLNDNTYHISYFTDGSTYEINVFLEYLTEEMQNDGGNDPSIYEVGNNLNLISP